MTQIVLMLGACTGPSATDATGPAPALTEATWLSGIYYRWSFFNHRVSYIHAVPNGTDQVDVSIIGGTSTTGQGRDDLPDGCASDTCLEFPFFDEAEVRIGWSRLSGASLGIGRADLEVGRSGGSGSVDIEMAGATGDVTALIRGITIDTDHALDGAPDCYQPKYGWHPAQIAASIDAVSLADGIATVDVSATFAAGTTMDDDRQCIDAVNDRAVVPFGVDVLVIAGHTGVADEAVAAAATYPFSGNASDPGEQDEVLPQPLTLDAPVLGWAAVDFAFNPDNPDGRGVYLRTFGFEIGADGASGLATNYSPVTQLHDMSYTFAGTARGVTVEGEVTSGTVETTLPVELDASERPVIHTLSLQ